MLYTLVMEFASPTFLDVEISLSVVIWCAVGGRGSLVGAALGALLVTSVQGSLSNTPTFLTTWTLIMGAIFIAVVLLLPNGLISLLDWLIGRLLDIRWRRSGTEAGPPIAPKGRGSWRYLK